MPSDHEAGTACALYAGMIAKPPITFDVIIQRDGAWCLEHWTEIDWLAWLEQSTPANLARHILRWTKLIEQAPELRYDLRAAVILAQHQLRLTECPAGRPNY